MHAPSVLLLLCFCGLMLLVCLRHLASRVEAVLGSYSAGVEGYDSWVRTFGGIGNLAVVMLCLATLWCVVVTLA